MAFKKFVDLTEQEQALFSGPERSISAHSVYDPETVSCLLFPFPRRKNGKRARYTMFKDGDTHNRTSFLAMDNDEAIRIAEQG